MPNTHETLVSLFNDIADAIRAKDGTSAEIVADDFPDRIEAIPTGGGGATVEALQVTTNGTYTAPTGTAYSPVTVAVPNSYTAGDEGKVVSNGALVAQTSRTVNTNGTIDTTTNSSVTISVSPSLTTLSVTDNGTYTPTGYDGYSSVTVAVSGGESYTYTTFNIGSSDTWTSDATSGGYYHDYTVNGVTSNSSPVLSPIITNASTASTINEVWSTVFMAETSSNKIRLYATNPITIAIEVAVKGY